MRQVSLSVHKIKEITPRALVFICQKYGKRASDAARDAYVLADSLKHAAKKFGKAEVRVCLPRAWDACPEDGVSDAAHR